MPRWIRWFTAVVLVCAPMAATRADDFTVTARVTTGESITGRLVVYSLEDGLVIQPDGVNGQRQFTAGDVVEITTDNRGPAPSADQIRLDLADGDLLFGRITGFEEDCILIDSNGIGTIKTPLIHVRTLRMRPRAAAERREGRANLRKQHRTGEDVAHLANGDRVAGLVTAVDADGVEMETDVGVMRLDRSGIVAVSMAALESDATNVPRVRILTTNGQQLTATQFDWEGIEATADVFGGTLIRIPGDRIARLDALGGRWEWLADLEPISYEHSAALALPWNWHANRNVKGGPIRVAGRAFDHGLGMHSESSITFDLKGRYKEFVTSMGLDDQSGAYANVDVEIRIDGQLKFQQESLTPGTLYGPVRLEIPGASRIKLSVLFGANADIQDRFNWVEPALIR